MAAVSAAVASGGHWRVAIGMSEWGVTMLSAAADFLVELDPVSHVIDYVAP
jgi:hypothetical protein